MIGKPTLIVHTTYFPANGAPAPADDPERQEAVRLGNDLYALLTRSKGDTLAWGAGIPVRIATAWDRIDTTEAELVLIVPVLGGLAFQSQPIRNNALKAMQGWGQAPAPARVVPVFASQLWRTVEDQMPAPLLTELYAANDPRRATLNEILHVLARMLAKNEAYASQLFISHAKADLAATEHAAERIRDYVTSQTTGKAFFDRVSVLPGEDFTAQLDREASHGVFVAVRGDLYASRAWCRRELLRAKQRCLPTLTVEVLSTGETRSAPYAGNGPTIVWGRSKTESERTATTKTKARARATTKTKASSKSTTKAQSSSPAPTLPEAIVVTRAMVEAVRHLHFLQEAARVIAASDLPETTVPLSRPPELLDLAALRERTDAALVLLHPDPPLPAFEHAVLQDVDKRVRAVTPTTAFSNVIGSSIRTPLDGWKVSLSVSLSPDASETGGRDGSISEHVHDAVTFLARALVGVGASLAHGGDFRENGYTRLLAQVVVAYNETSRRSADFLHTYPSATIDPSDGADQPSTLHSLRGHPLASVPYSPDRDARPPEPFYHSDMRRVMAIETQARVLIAGAARPKPQDLEGYMGRYPGIVEEAWRTLESGKPLYVVGGFGGGAALVVEALAGRNPSGLDDRTWSNNRDFAARAATLDGHALTQQLGLPGSQQAMAAAIYQLGRQHLSSDDSSRAWNGLTLAENQTLFHTRDPLTLTALVLKGLIAKSAASAKDKLRIELVEGDVSHATNVELLVFPTFRDVALSGAGAVLDRVSSGAATQAHRARTPVPARSAQLGADYVYAADLDDVNVSLQDVPAHARRAASEVAETVRRHGFKRVGIVTVFGNVAENLDAVVPAMVEGLRTMADVEVSWFERDSMRAALIASLLSTNDAVVLTRREFSLPVVQQAPSSKKRTMVTIRHDGPELDVALLVPHANGLSPVVRSPFDAGQRRALAGGPQDAAPTSAELTKRGDHIARLLFGTDAGNVLDAVGQSELVITHDEPSAGVPYEALSWQKDGKWIRPATRGGLVRHLLTRGIAAGRGLTRPPRAGQLHVLVVINPTGDLPGARMEGEALVERLKALGSLRVSVLNHAEATVENVRAGLQDPTLDVLHYCGHAFYNGPGPDGSGLNCSDGDLTLGALQQVRSVPRLVFFNACQAGRVRGGAPAAGEPQAFAQFFLQAGVDAYIGTFWLVSDGGAETFASTVYEALAKGGELGESVVLGRRALEQLQNSDWANYVLYGDVGFRLVQSGTALPGASTDRPPELPPPSLRLDGTTLVARWVFAPNDAPAEFSAAALDGDTGDPFVLARPLVIERRDGWWGPAPIVTWLVTVSLSSPLSGKLELRPSEGTSLHATGSAPPSGGPRTRALSPPLAPAMRGRSAPDAVPAEQAQALAALLEQQPDGGRSMLEVLQPSADPDELRARILAAAGGAPTRALWPLKTKVDVDAQALAAFNAAYHLDVTTEMASDVQFQTKEDWARYAFTPGAATFVAGGDVNQPAWRGLAKPAVDLTHDVRPGEFNNGIELALFSDNGNGRHAALQIARQIVDSQLPYAFHLGDVYYGGSQLEFDDYFTKPLHGMFARTELFSVTGNHEMYAKGEYFQQFLRNKAAAHPNRQRQSAEMFRLRGPGFQILGIDSMFVGWNARRLRVHDRVDERVLDVLDSWLSEHPDDLTILMTTNQPWHMGSESLTHLYRSLRRTIAGRVDLWFWGNVHYAALYEPWTFPDTGTPTRSLIGSCIGHGGYPFYTSKLAPLPEHVKCRWLETQSRFWPEQKVRPDVGANGWCKLALAREGNSWAVKLTFIDWVGRERLRANMERAPGGSLRLVSVMESELAHVGAQPSWVVR